MQAKVAGVVAAAVCVLLMLQLAANSGAREGTVRLPGTEAAAALDADEGEPLVRWVVPGVFAFSDCGGANAEESVQYEPLARSSRPHMLAPGKKKVDIAMITSLTLHYKPNKFGRTPAKRTDPRAAKSDGDGVGECRDRAAEQALRQLEREERDAKGSYFAHSRELARVSIDNKLQYSTVQRYPFYYYHSHLTAPDRSPTWAKIQVLQSYLADYEWLFWIDVDAFVMNMDVTLESIIDVALEVNPNADIILTNDWNGLNNGVFFIRNCPWAHGFLQEVWDSYTDLKMQIATFHEQEAMQTLLQQRRHGQHAVYLPLHVMNSFAPNIQPDKVIPTNFPRYSYEPGDFILHTPGLHVKEKLLAVERATAGLRSQVNVLPGRVNWRIELQDYTAAPSL